MGRRAIVPRRLRTKFNLSSVMVEQWVVDAFRRESRETDYSLKELAESVLVKAAQAMAKRQAAKG